MGKSIFEPVVMRSLTAKNRLVRSATWEGIATPGGSMTEQGYGIYDELAAGGVGLIIGGFTSVADNDVYINGQMRLSNDSLVPQYRCLTDMVHAHGVPIVAQLALGAYYRGLSGGRLMQIEPDEMTENDIAVVVRLFAEAARRAQVAGFDGVQIHVAHFFFLSRFVSPAVNHRSDAYGGSTENRACLVVEIIDAVRSSAPGLHVTAKVNASDRTQGGLEPNEALELAKLYCVHGLDSIEVSANGTSIAGVRPHKGEAYFAPFAAQLAEVVDTPVMVVGGMRSLDVMQEVLDESKIELISLSRPLLCEPDLPRKLQEGATTESRCVSCNACYSSPAHRCIFRR